LEKGTGGKIRSIPLNSGRFEKKDRDKNILKGGGVKKEKRGRNDRYLPYQERGSAGGMVKPGGER